MKPQNEPSEMSLALELLRPILFKAVLFSLIISLLALAPTVYMLEVYDRVVNSRNSVTLLMLTILVLMVYAMMEILEKVRTSMLRSAGIQFDHLLSKRVYGAMFESFLKRQSGGNMQILNDLRTVREFLHNPALLAVMETPISLVALMFSFLISPILGVATLLGGGVQIVVALMNERATRKPLMFANQSASGSIQFAEASLRNAHVMESMGMFNDIQVQWQKRHREFIELQAKASEGAGLWTNMSKTVQVVLGSFLLGLGAFLTMNNALNGGPAMMIIGSVLGGRVLAPLTQLIAQWNGVVTVRESWGRLELFLAQAPAKQDNMSLPAPKGQLSVDGIVAGPPAPPGQHVSVLRGIKFSLNSGEVLAVIGPSASGKTSLAKALVGLWPSSAGKVRLDGADIYAWNKSELGPYLGYLSQTVELLDGSVAENIARFGDVDMTQVEAAAKLVGVHDIIMALPLGYETNIGRDGAVLSGGQRQRVGLARAMYGKPVLVVLDEPNSSLDEAGDTALANAIASLKQLGTTFVIMTHRSNVLVVADKILLMREGTQQAFGPRDEVLAAMQQARELNEK
jgi:ATP-binding cassette subfamily C exporter for protease/lipase